jgi:hypothetical protein
VIEPAQRQEMIADTKETYRVTSRFCDSVLRAVPERDSEEEVEERREEVSRIFARSGVRVVAIM